MEPMPDHSKLAVNEAGLARLRAIPGPVAPVVVIGPYRSGKSFLLNQLMNVSCGESAKGSAWLCWMGLARTGKWVPCLIGRRTESPQLCDNAHIHPSKLR